MTNFHFTDEQISIIDHDGSAFISACPGAGKTRCIVERARVILSGASKRRSLAFLSFTNAAISELQQRLIGEQVVSSSVFPHFIGTFDSFIWRFIAQPFGVDNCNNILKLIPDIGEILVTPFKGAQDIPLHFFDRKTGRMIESKARKVGFKRDPAPYEAAAKLLREKLFSLGHLDFSCAREIALENLRDVDFSKNLGLALNARFGEIIVDEAQDCNPEDIFIIDWLKTAANIPLKIVCDPHQSIYGFRGGVSKELFKYATTFNKNDCLKLTGNFRSSAEILFLEF